MYMTRNCLLSNIRSLASSLRLSGAAQLRVRRPGPLQQRVGLRHAATAAGPGRRGRGGGIDGLHVAGAHQHGLGPRHPDAAPCAALPHGGHGHGHGAHALPRAGDDGLGLRYGEDAVGRAAAGLEMRSISRRNEAKRAGNSVEQRVSDGFSSFSRVFRGFYMGPVELGPLETAFLRSELRQAALEKLRCTEFAMPGMRSQAGS